MIKSVENCFSDTIKYQLDFFQNSHFITPFGEYTNQDILLEKINNSLNKYDKFFLLSREEAIGNLGWFEKISKLISDSKNEVYISSATSTKLYKGFNPLVNIAMWNTTYTRNTIDWSSDDIKLFDLQNFNNITKIIKGILSVRKNSKSRTYLFNQLNFSEFEGIARYAKWPEDEDIETSNYLELVDTFPTTLDLINEYKKSYISFVVESENSSWSRPLTEKTLIAFLTETIPIFCGGYNYLTELEDMGFYTFNHEFGFTKEMDYTYPHHEVKMDLFKSAIDNYNNKSISTIKDIYEKNYEKIRHNSLLVRELLKYKKDETKEILI